MIPFEESHAPFRSTVLLGEETYLVEVRHEAPWHVRIFDAAHELRVNTRLKPGRNLLEGSGIAGELIVELLPDDGPEPREFGQRPGCGRRAVLTYTPEAEAKHVDVRADG